AAEVLAVEAAPVDVADIALRALDGEMLAVENFAANLHAAVALSVLETDLKRQLEVLVLLLAAQEGVELQTLGRGGADDRSILDAPVFHEPFPAFEILAVIEITLGRIISQSQLREAALEILHEDEWASALAQASVESSTKPGSTTDSAPPTAPEPPTSEMSST